jgi:hypothetical protein
VGIMKCQCQLEIQCCNVGIQCCEYGSFHQIIYEWKKTTSRSSLFYYPYKVNAPMTKSSPRTAQPPHKIKFENSRRNFGYVGHQLVKCDIAFEFTQCAVTKLLRSTCVCLDSICDSFHKSKYLLFLFFCRRIPTSQSTIRQNLK